MIIAVDAVGGDHFPENPIAGAIEALAEDKNLKVLLVGPEEMIKTELEKYNYDKDRLLIQDAPQIITMDDSPAAAVKGKPQSSIAIGIAAHKQNKCDAFVSAGNTGALLAASIFILGKLPGVQRPTIAATYPTIKGFRLLMDAGANLELKPEMYVQFAQMGTIYAKEILEVSEPKVGLLNVGEEPEKGADIHREAFTLLSALPNFEGNIEGGDILPATVDVFLSDGFTGNIVLKLGESFPEALQYLVGKTMKESGLEESTQKMVAGILQKSLRTFNYEHVGGVPFMGVNGISMVGHGGSSPLAIKNLILNAARCVELKINDKIVASLQ